MTSNNDTAVPSPLNNDHRDLKDIANATLVWDDAISPPSPIPSGYKHIFPNPPSLTEVETTKYDFIIQTSTTFAYYLKTLSEPKTTLGENGKIGIGDRVVFEESAVIWHIQETVRWDNMSVVLRLESVGLPHILLEVEKRWMYVLYFLS